MAIQGKRRTSPVTIEAGRRALRAYNARRHLLPKCGATTKRAGLPCVQTAMENGRCRYHGGKTPKGKDWHRITRPANADKATTKMGTLERRTKQRAQRLAKMTADEQAQYRAWRQSHAPGPPEAREARRQQRRQNAEFRARGSAHAHPEPSSEMQALLDRIAELKAKQKELTKQTEQKAVDAPEEYEIFR